MNYSIKIVFAGLLATYAVAVSAKVITFDDLQTNYDPASGAYGAYIPNGYSGLNWSDQFYVLKGDSFPGTGYENGVGSAPNVALNGWDLPAYFSSSASFTLNSIDVTKAWSEGGTLFQGYIGTTLAFSKTVFSTTSGPTHAVFNWAGINAVVLSDADGSQHTVIDNVDITPSTVPLPATASLMLSGLGLLGFGIRRNKTIA